jgi:hypothetical protein
VKLLDSFKQVVNPTSNKPPRINKNHAIEGCELKVVSCELCDWMLKS